MLGNRLTANRMERQTAQSDSQKTHAQINHQESETVI